MSSDGNPELNFRRGLEILIGKTLKVFLHPPPPLERESLVEVAGLIIEQKRNLLSMKK
jgi:hypothetical protein